MQGGAGGAPQEWVPPQPPCDVKAGHFRVTSAIVDLQNAASKPNARERLLKDANDVLTRAITQDKQDKNAGAWYYLGRYYVEVKDAPGADTAFQRAVALAPQCKDDIDRHRERLWIDVINHGLPRALPNRSVVRIPARAWGAARALRPTVIQP